MIILKKTFYFVFHIKNNYYFKLFHLLHENSLKHEKPNKDSINDVIYVFFFLYANFIFRLRYITSWTFI